MYYQDLRAFLDVLEERGKLCRFAEPVNKDTELAPLMRVQFCGLPEHERQVVLFENVTNTAGGTYEMTVAGGVYGVSEEIAALGLGCERPEEILERFHHGLEHQIPPVLVQDAPVQEEVHVGEDLESCGLDEIPVPVEEVGFSQIIRTGLPMISHDPETGIRNVGTYNTFFHDRTRAVAGISPGHHAMRYHWQSARRRGEDLPIAIVIGALPNVMLVGCSRIPYGIDELAVAGGIAGRPVEVVRCKTIPVEVPAHAEIVIEGRLSITDLGPRLAFGEYPGYMNMERNSRPLMHITAITHRKHAIHTPVLVGMPPSDNNVLNGLANAAMLYHTLRYDCGFPVNDVYFPQMGGGNDFCILRIDRGTGRQAWQALEASAGLLSATKYIVVVDWDVDIRDLELLMWTLSYRTQPEIDVNIQRGRNAGLDPSAAVTGSTKGQMESAPGGPSDYFRVLIDATMKGAYPPVALPKQEYMERALKQWLAHPDLPRPRLRTPWHGYTLGYWDEEDQRLADILTAGDYRALGRIAAEKQLKASDVTH
jgi:4-hydroxy-3-polyprenylbenzoate decarboxylase